VRLFTITIEGDESKAYQVFSYTKGYFVIADDENRFREVPVSKCRLSRHYLDASQQLWWKMLQSESHPDE
jgi:hypothetical protein